MGSKISILAIVAWLGVNFSVVIASASTCKEHTHASLSCKDPGIDCYRFDYTSIRSFSKSVILHAEDWRLKSPKIALSKITEHGTFEFDISSTNTVNSFFEQRPETIYAFGRYVERENKPREWLFVAEQAFIRSWNSLLRNTSG